MELRHTVGSVEVQITTYGSLYPQQIDVTPIGVFSCDTFIRVSSAASAPARKQDKAGLAS